MIMKLSYMLSPNDIIIKILYHCKFYSLPVNTYIQHGNETTSFLDGSNIETKGLYLLSFASCILWVAFRFLA